ncbi:hypothetical protein B0D71_15540 [Pseudomonas laurylsulfativorans]|uniref:Uncharacterized protein n=1 Tax=Pseudomonas laurylsulfativorans TaxID=1943631 RepID=A0A2S3VNU0_9PSED|nr:hypothetical protein B0D71_15540 [Pseudomonas laurylsulfativorans]
MPPLGREAAPAFPTFNRMFRVYGRFAAERGQAPSPQRLAPTIGNQRFSFHFSLNNNNWRFTCPHNR